MDSVALCDIMISSVLLQISTSASEFRVCTLSFLQDYNVKKVYFFNASGR